MHYACMNKQIHVRDIEEQTHSRLVDMADAEGLSLSEFLRGKLTEMAKPPSNAKLFARLRTREPVNLKTSAEEMVREDRDSKG
jgi:hypothetical protein